MNDMMIVSFSGFGFGFGFSLVFWGKRKWERNGKRSLREMRERRVGFYRGFLGGETREARGE